MRCMALPCLSGTTTVWPWATQGTHTCAVKQALSIVLAQEIHGAISLARGIGRFGPGYWGAGAVVSTYVCVLVKEAQPLFPTPLYMQLNV